MQITEEIMTKSEEFKDLLLSKLGSQILSSECSGGDLCVYTSVAAMHDFFQLLKLDSELGFDVLLSVTAVDWMDERDERFEVVYHLLSTRNALRLRVKIAVPEEEPEVESLVWLWDSANFLERETWDMYGIRFKGHPDLRRILMYDEFTGHPLRKDYPVQGKQPRVSLRHPEVRNTARDLERPDLVKINRRDAR